MTSLNDRPDLVVRLVTLIGRGSGGGRARGALRIWPLWERLARAVHPAVAIPGAPHGLLSVHVHSYRGAAVQLADGTAVRDGDPVAEIHVNNGELARIAARGKLALIRMAGADLRALARWMSSEHFSQDVRALYGITILGPGAEVVGFTVRERSIGLTARLERLYMAGLLAIYAVEGTGRLSQGTTVSRYPHEVWMSRGELMRRYDTERTGRGLKPFERSC